MHMEAMREGAKVGTEDLLLSPLWGAFRTGEDEGKLQTSL